MHETRKHVRRIEHRLASSELNIVLVEKDGMAAELVNAHIERHARTRARLREDHRPGLSFQRWRRMTATAFLETLSQSEYLRRLVRSEIRFL